MQRIGFERRASERGGMGESWPFADGLSRSVCFADGDGEGEGGGAAGGDGDGEASGAGTGDGGGAAESGKDEARLLKDTITERNRLRADMGRVTREAQTRREQLEELQGALGGIAPEELKELIAARAETERKAAEDRGDYEKLMIEEKEKTRSAQGERDTVQQAWDAEKVANSLLTDSGSLDAINPAQIVRLYSADFELKSGKAVHRTLLNDDGEAMGPRQFLEQERAGDGANLFRSQMKNGSGQAAGDAGEPEGVIYIDPADPQSVVRLEKLIAEGKGDRIQMRRTN